ncbi:Hypothetical protein CINCED_3A024632 [Cinara cedri]|uniref:Uncharacterized protein n=1 Tax=Cinara cedri TaxID=506608 RepID=A0A5E4MIG9_9HEMI|nr:Hypothetical protein CINCED_3A024632 [Cinara cedri]
MEDLNCPRLDQLCDEDNLPCCIFHMDVKPKQCTFYKEEDNDCDDDGESTEVLARLFYINYTPYTLKKPFLHLPFGFHLFSINSVTRMVLR